MDKNIYGISTSNLIQALTDHSDLIKINCPIDGNDPVVVVDDALTPTPKGCREFNTSNFAKLILMDEEAKDQFHEAFGLSSKRPASALYCLVGDSKHTPLCEIGYSMRSMNGDVGIEMYVSHACGFLIADEPVPDQVKDIITYVASRYTGELSLILDEDGVVCRILFGHAPQFMAIYAEFIGGNVDELIEHVLDSGSEAPIYRTGTALMLAVTKYPYPNTNGDTAYMRAEIEAEKHLWRMPFGLVFVTAWSDDDTDSSGTSFSQCRKRIFRTIRRARKYDDYLCYRTDGGYSLTYSIVTERYLALQR